MAFSPPRLGRFLTSVHDYSTQYRAAKASRISQHPDWYAIGDSYISGEGTFDYYPNSNSARSSDFCHRSPISYASLLGIPEANNFACSGSTIAEIAKTGNQGESAQIARLPRSARLILIGAGGDSFHFSTVMKDCLKIGPFQGSCATELLTEMEGMEIPDASPAPREIRDCNFSIGNYRNQFICMLLMAHEHSPKAKIFIIGYPRLFRISPTTSCSDISVADQKFINVGDAALNNALERWTSLTAEYGTPVSFISTWNAFASHEECQPASDMNPLLATSAASPIALVGHTPIHKGCHSPPDTYGACSESFHPTRAGYLALAHSIGPAINAYLHQP
jgi:hypothetical protein